MKIIAFWEGITLIFSHLCRIFNSIKHLMQLLRCFPGYFFSSPKRLVVSHRLLNRIASELSFVHLIFYFGNGFLKRSKLAFVSF